MTYRKGQSGNLSGRPAMPPEVREAIRANGELAVRRMSQLLLDDTAWGPNAWMKPREQIQLLSVAQERAYGKAQSVAVDHFHGGTIDVKAKHAPLQDQLRRISDQFPERKAQRRIVDAKVVDMKTSDSQSP